MEEGGDAEKEEFQGRSAPSSALSQPGLGRTGWAGPRPVPQSLTAWNNPGMAEPTLMTKQRLFCHSSVCGGVTYAALGRAPFTTDRVQHSWTEYTSVMKPGSHWMSAAGVISGPRGWASEKSQAALYRPAARKTKVEMVRGWGEGSAGRLGREHSHQRARLGGEYCKLNANAHTYVGHRGARW